MKFKELALLFENDLKPIYEEGEAKELFLFALEYLLKLNRKAYLLNKDEEIAPQALIKMNLVLDQLKAHKPIQYIIGETTFYGLPFKVNESVLIPRPETEELVEWVIEKVNSSELKTLNILDIGTGSGCIAISLKKNLAYADVRALDISSEALSVARQNALLNNVDVSFFEHNILLHPISILDTKYSILVSNPPYITQTEKEEMHENVLANEPHLALFVSNEAPLIFYEAIADYALVNLIENGLLFFEINEYLGKETVVMLETKGFVDIELRKDMQEKNRMICCRRN